MKNRILTRTCLLAGMTALNIAFMPTLQAQTTTSSPANPTGSEANTKSTDDSAAQQRAGSTSTVATPASAPDKTSSKDTTTSLDKNPSTAPTDSANASATKNPTTATTEDSTAPDMKSEAKNEATGTFSDKHFLVKAAEGGMTEVDLGQLAQQKGSSDDVKQFGARMVTDHTNANNELKGLAQQKGITVPTKLDASHQAVVDRFNKLSGPDFDRAYVNDMVEDHQKDAAEFQQASTSAKDPDVKAFATKTLAVVKTHLAHVQSLQSQIK